MPHWLDPRIALVVLALAAILLAVGVRGVRVDRDPRCRARRCRYPLRELLDAKRNASEPEWPVTCPECGRVMESESRARRGARKKLRSLLALAIVLALPSLGLLGFEGYARWQSMKAIGSMPLWMLLRQAEKDSEANSWPHQKELFDRAAAGRIDPASAPRVVERILRWQRDPLVGFGFAGDALFELAEQGFVTEEQQNREWENQWIFGLTLPETIEPGMPVPISITARHRAGVTHGPPLIERTPWVTRYQRSLQTEWQTTIRVDAMRIDGREVEIPEELRDLRSLSYTPAHHRVRTVGWWVNRGPWAHAVAPEHDPASEVGVEIELVWHFGESGQHGLQQDPEQAGRWVTAEQWLAHRGVPTTGRTTLRGTTRIVPHGSITIDTLSQPDFESWLRAHLSRSVIKVVRQAQGDHFVYIAPASPDRKTLPADAPAVFGRIDLIHKDWRIGVAGVAAHPSTGRLGEGGFSLGMHEPIGRFLVENPTGWELELTALPGLAMRTAERPSAWSGQPVRVPISVELDLRCWEGQWSPMLFPATGPSPTTD